ncbi:hypothetical protein EI427_00465 [Flammeovirga pectinis]|uniref:Uncharacterized protein n=1 Tax=Flammeovirga pectinis TaxID=2494373 RepID=A0A3Q9FL45_9BACT|nr:hypothetical protein [Flammeovirga pectinis]AZQ60733.1 hypothetical protein EI427_00465 [Flammeovirga pectinis]
MGNKLNHTQLTDDIFIDQFRNGSLDPALFNHEAHLRLAWLYITTFDLERAEYEIQKQLQNYVKIVGASDKYHKTLTIVAVRMVNHFIQKSKSTNFGNFIREFPQMNKEFKQLINTHYSFNIFTSEKARQEFLEPDLLPLV